MDFFTLFGDCHVHCPKSKFFSNPHDQANFPLAAAKLEQIVVKFGQVSYFAFTKTLESERHRTQIYLCLVELVTLFDERKCHNIRNEK